MFDFLQAYPWALPLVIFFGRICDVTLGTLRIIFVSKGEKMKAPIVGFFEVFIWVVVISQIFSHANDLTAYLAYADGYAAGNFVGITASARPISAVKAPFPKSRSSKPSSVGSPSAA